jgi:hypothetical protein
VRQHGQKPLPPFLQWIAAFHNNCWRALALKLLEAVMPLGRHDGGRQWDFFNGAVSVSKTCPNLSILPVRIGLNMETTVMSKQRMIGKPI